jgi:hypothetical protein
MQVPDVLVEVAPEEDICKCGGTLTIEESFTADQKIEIPVIKPVVTEYRLQQKVCVKCKRKYKAHQSHSYQISL